MFSFAALNYSQQILWLNEIWIAIQIPLCSLQITWKCYRTYIKKLLKYGLEILNCSQLAQTRFYQYSNRTKTNVVDRSMHWYSWNHFLFGFARAEAVIQTELTKAHHKLQTNHRPPIGRPRKRLIFPIAVARRCNLVESRQLIRSRLKDAKW